MTKTVLITVADDRFGRKDGLYGITQDKITNIFESNPEFGIKVLPYKWQDIEKSQFYKDNKVLLDNTDAARNGRAYKPYCILRGLNTIKEGEFLIYNDSSPEIWKKLPNDYKIPPIYNLKIIQDLCESNNDILTCFIRWSNESLKEGDLGKATHKNYTLNICMDRMRLRFYEDSYQCASGMIVIRKTKKTVDLIQEWLYYNCIDECCALGKADVEGDASFWAAESHAEFGKEGYKMGCRHDQSIFGLLLSRTNQKFIEIIHNDLNAHNFLQFCRTDTQYNFIESNPKIKIEDKVENKQGTILNIYDIINDEYKVGQSDASCYMTKRENLKLIK